MILPVPRLVFVPFEWNGAKWVKRDDIPRFKEPEEALQWAWANPEALTRDGKPVYWQWIECHEPEFIKEFLRGVGTPEWLTLKH
jgi:hypothetical protein